MRRSTEPADREQQLLQHARREGLLIMAVWTAALVWSVAVGHALGYRPAANDLPPFAAAAVGVAASPGGSGPLSLAAARIAGDRPTSDIQVVLGMPAWVFWSVVLPWGLCFLFSIWFCFAHMADDDLGRDPDERQEYA